MIYYFNPEQNGRVKSLFQPKDGKEMDGFLTTETIPEIPDFGEGFTAELYYIDNELVWKSAKIGTEPAEQSQI